MVNCEHTPLIQRGEETRKSRALREAGYPLIILLKEGFPELDSPNYI